ncbi:MAG: D-alanine--D-alanine ligase, partial [Marinirhabdus sp.]
MGKKNVFVAMGGYGTERDISIKSGGTVCRSLSSEKYNVYPVHILSEGWFMVGETDKKHPVNKGDFSVALHQKTIRPDVIYNTVHGTPGEDGLMQAYWELLGIPHTSPGFYASAISFNKRDCLSVLQRYGLRCANAVYLNKGNNIDENEIIKITGLPCFVKPNRAGSSFGVSKVSTVAALLPAIQVAFKEDTEIMIETALVGTEVSVGAYKIGGTVHVLPPTEIVPENDFFDYGAKYLGKSEEITPARLPDRTVEKVKAEAHKIYTLLNMKGVTRSDFIVQEGEPFFIETNTTP